MKRKTQLCIDLFPLHNPSFPPVNSYSIVCLLEILVTNYITLQSFIAFSKPLLSTSTCIFQVGHMTSLCNNNSVSS